MKSFICITLLTIAPFALAEPRTISSIDYVYELGHEKSFDFAGGEPHECGSNMYRAPSGSDGAASRKFSLVLTAFVAEKRILVNTEGCEGNRMKAGWIRLLKD